MSILAVFVAALSAFLLGGLWYSPVMFAKPWAQAAGVDSTAPVNAAKLFGGSFVLALLGAAVFGAFVGPNPALGFAVGAGASAGFAWVAGSFGINYLFERRSLKLLFINGGYHTVQYTLYGVIFGLLG